MYLCKIKEEKKNNNNNNRMILQGIKFYIRFIVKNILESQK